MITLNRIVALVALAIAMPAGRESAAGARASMYESGILSRTERRHLKQK